MRDVKKTFVWPALEELGLAKASRLCGGNVAKFLLGGVRVLIERGGRLSVEGGQNTILSRTLRQTTEAAVVLAVNAASFFSGSGERGSASIFGRLNGDDGDLSTATREVDVKCKRRWSRAREYREVREGTAYKWPAFTSIRGTGDLTVRFVRVRRTTSGDRGCRCRRACVPLLQEGSNRDGEKKTGDRRKRVTAGLPAGSIFSRLPLRLAEICPGLSCC